MKNFFTSLCAVLLITSSLIANAGEMDLMLRSVVRDPPAKRLYKAELQVNGASMIPCLIKTKNPKLTSEAIALAGGTSSSAAGNIISATLPDFAIQHIVARDEVIFAEAAVPLSRKMDTARAATFVDVVQNGSALGVPYLGTNVVVGAVDDSLDYGHPDYLGSTGDTRIQYVEQTTGGSTLTCTKGQISGGCCSIEDGGQGLVHGSHVTGIATSSNPTYTGVAPVSDIMFVFLQDTSGQITSSLAPTSFSTVVLDATTKLFQNADTMDKPAVVNLSLGTSVGPHDGSSLLEEGLSNLTSAKPGRIIINAAGNEQVVPCSLLPVMRNNIGGIHASVDVAASQNEGSRIMVLDGSSAASSDYDGTLVDLWLSPGEKDNCSVAVYAYTNGRAMPSFTFPGLASTGDAVLATADVSFSSSTTTPVTGEGGGVKATIEIEANNILNNKPHAAIVLSPLSGSGGALENVWFDVVVRANAGGTCTGNMWLYYDFTSIHDFLKGVAGMGFDVATGVNGAGYALTDGDSFYTTTIPATAQGVIAAGSWMQPKPAGSSSSVWIGNDGLTHNGTDLTCSITGDLSSFSSLGPTADGRIKPEIVAPGEPIISSKAREVAVSQALQVGEDHFVDAGTSMASPHVAGIVALLLERNNTLGVDQVRTALTQGASTSGMTAKTADPANSFGAGKVNAASVLASVSPDTSAYAGTGDLSAEGCSGTCALVQTNGSSVMPSALLFLSLSLIICKVGLLRLSSPRV